MKELRRSGEDYLEAILVISRRSGEVRSVDVAREMGVTKPSVSRAMGLLKEGGFIRINNDGYITLTQAGSIIAESIYERHVVLTDWLVDMGVDDDLAAEDACKLEHDISRESFSKLKAHIERCNRCKSRECF